MHVPVWWPGKSLPWLWESSLRLSSLYCVPECACQRDILPRQIQGPPACAGWVRGHPIPWWISLAHPGSESQWSHTNEGHFFSVASLCKSNNDWFTLVSKYNAHSIAFSPFPQSSWSGFLISWRKIWPPHWFCSFYQVLSMFLLLMRLVKKSSSKPHHHVKVVRHGQVSSIELQADLVVDGSLKSWW